VDDAAHAGAAGMSLEVDFAKRWPGGPLIEAAFASDAAVLALFGRSGSGKSTVVNALAGLLRPDTGRIVVEGEVLYADDKFDYLIDGSIISTKNMSNLTEQRKQKLSAIPFDELPLELAFKKVKGNGERKLAVFSDPDCPFCKRVENDLAKLDNVTIYMFLFPIDSLHPKAPEMSKKIWCSPDRVKAWDDYMQKGTIPAADSSCQNPVDKIVEYGRKKGINATPTLVFPNGDRVPGAVSAAQMESLLSGKEAKESKEN
jgi:thiol:disulfide interchange protein DsbC